MLQNQIPFCWSSTNQYCRVGYIIYIFCTKDCANGVIRTNQVKNNSLNLIGSSECKIYPLINSIFIICNFRNLINNGMLNYIANPEYKIYLELCLQF